MAMFLVLAATRAMMTADMTEISDFSIPNRFCRNGRMKTLDVPPDDLFYGPTNKQLMVPTNNTVAGFIVEDKLLDQCHLVSDVERTANYLAFMFTAPDWDITWKQLSVYLGQATSLRLTCNVESCHYTANGPHFRWVRIFARGSSQRPSVPKMPTCSTPRDHNVNVLYNLACKRSIVPVILVQPTGSKTRLCQWCPLNRRFQ